jgi:hypothetical protein
VNISHSIAGLGLFIKSKFKCVHLVDTCSADERVKKVADDGKTETWNCWCTCKCGATKIPKTMEFQKAYLDELRAMGLE